MNRNYIYALSVIILSILLLGLSHAKSEDVSIMGSIGADILYPLNGISYNYTIPFFNYSITLDDVFLDSCWYTLNGIETSISDCSLNSVLFTPTLADNNHTLTFFVNATDGFSRYFKKISFLIDTLPPQISITNPSDENYGDKITDLEYTLIEANPSSCWYSLDSGQTNNTIICGNNVSGLSSNEDWNTWTVWASDTLGHVNSSSVTFWVDSIFPLISFNPETMPSGNYSQDWIYASISASDDNLANTRINLYNETGFVSSVSSPSGFSKNFTNLPDGIYNLSAAVKDIVGHITSTEIRKIILDSHAPVVSLISPANNNYFDVGTTDATLVFRVSDFSSISSCSLTINSIVNQTSSSILRDADQNFALPVSSGEYFWSVSCTENFETFNKIGNSNTSSFTILSALTFPAGTDYTNLSIVPDITSTSFFVSNSFGIINWTNPLDLSRGLDWAQFINLSENRVEVNSASAPELNQPAVITLYSINWTNPEVLRDGSPCGAYCSGQVYDNSTLTLTFYVTGFSVYTTREYEAPKSSGSSVGSGGGGNCRTNWTCTNWTSCINNQQTRICTKLKDWCYADPKPIEGRSCTILPEIVQETPVPQVEETPAVKEPEVKIETQGRNWLGLTGAVIGANAVPFAGALAFIIIIAGIYLFFKIRQDKEAKRIKKFLVEVRKMSPKW